MPILLDDYYTALHGAYNAMRDAFQLRGISQDAIAVSLGVDKALISKRLRGDENLTLKTLSFMGTALKCRIEVRFVPYEQVGISNYFATTNSAEMVEVPKPNTDAWRKLPKLPGTSIVVRPI